MNGKNIVTYIDMQGNAYKIENVAQVDFSFLGNIDDSFGKKEDWNFDGIKCYQNNAVDLINSIIQKLKEVE